MPPLSLPCPAKINLFLEVQGRRPDGFHDLGTLFQALEVGDSLSAEPWDSIALEGAEGLTETLADNLVVRAAMLLKERSAARLPAGAGIRFALRKRLPAGGGLGGGSSDAAAALRLADAVWQLGTPAEELRAMGAELGSDVPFFLSTPTAFAEGRGERLAPAPAPHPFHVVVATPRCHVETPWAYRELGYAPGTPRATPPRWPRFRDEYAEKAQDPAFFKSLHNDFEEPVLARFREIRDVHSALRDFDPVRVLLSGSGASVFALFEGSVRADEALQAVAPSCRFSVRTTFWDKAGFF